MKFERYLADFESYLSAIRLSERTIETYSTYAKRFCHFLETYYPRIRSFERITKDIVLDYQSYLSTHKSPKGRRLCNKTQGLILRALKKLFSYLMKGDLILKDPTTVIVMPKEEQTLPRNILSENEVFSLLESIRMNDPVGIRNRAIIELFYACGIRTSELCHLKIHDVDLKEQTVTIVKGKGGKSRQAPIGQYGAYYIQLYLDKARRHLLKGKLTDPAHLFLSKRGNPFNKSTINRTVIKSVSRNMRINKHISCYTFRHSVASQLLHRKVDIAHIAKLLGHASLRTTQQYLHIDITDLKKVHSLCHPRETTSHKPED